MPIYGKYPLFNLTFYLQTIYKLNSIWVKLKLIDKLLFSKKEFFMKSTKNTVLAGIVLATALFASVQVTAMDQRETTKRIKALEMEINIRKAELQIALEDLQKTRRKNVFAPGDEITSTQIQKRINEKQQQIRALETELNNIKAYQSSPFYN
jgi:hypothetical protein